MFGTEPVVHGGLHQSEIQEGWVVLLALPPIDLQMRKGAPAVWLLSKVTLLIGSTWNLSGHWEGAEHAFSDHLH